MLDFVIKVALSPYIKKLLITLLLLMDIEFRVLDRPVVQADIIIKKIIKRLSQIDKTIKS